MRKSVARSIAGRFFHAASLSVLLAGWVCTQEMMAVSVVDANNQVIYEIIEGTQTVEISSTQSQGSNSGTLVLPKTVTDLNTESVNYGKTFTVIAMKPNAFQNCPMEAVVIEAEIPEIPEYAFSSCWNMQSVTLPETVTRISRRAFSYCSSLKKVVTGPNLEEIDNQAFENCSSMTEFDLSASTQLHRIGEYAFNYCYNMPFPAFPYLETLLIDRNAFYGCSNLGKVVIPQNAQIGRYAFSNTTITELIFPTEGNWSFGNPETELQPGWFAFQYATLPEIVTIPSSAKALPGHVFEFSYGMKNLVIEDNPQLVIGSCAFNYCNSLENVNFKGSVKSIEDAAFSHTGVTEIAIPPCEKIGATAFAHCDNLAAITFPDTEIPLIMDEVFAGNKSITEVVCPDWMKKISRGLFKDCSALKKVTFPANLEKINDYAFSGTALELPEENSMPASVKEIGSFAFSGVATLGKISLPLALEAICESAFDNCSNLQISNFDQLLSLTRVDKGAFRKCTSITSIKFPANLKQVGAKVALASYDNVTPGVFEDCTNLTDVEFNPGVMLGVNCFENSGIRAINWADGMQICQGVFKDCKGLSNVTIPGFIKEIPNDAFHGAGIFQLKIEDGVEIVGKRAFFRNVKMESIGGANTVKEIQTGAFAMAKGFNVLPPAVETVGAYAFWRSAIWGTITLHDKVKTIGECAYCVNNISKVIFPEFPDIDIDAIVASGDLPITFGGGVFANNLFEHIELPRWMVRVPAGMFQQKPEKDAYKMTDTAPDRVLITFHGPDMENDCRYQLKSVVFAPGTVEIGDDAFLNNLNLRIGDFPSTITRYGCSSFENCGSALTTEEVTDDEGNTTTQEVYLGRLVAADGCEFSDNAFANAKLQGIEFQGCATFHESSLANMKHISEIEFPECMTEIPIGFCKGWSILEKVRFKNNKVVKILNEAFMNCPKLGGELDLSKLDDLVEIGDKAFMNTPVTSVKWPSGEFTLGEKAFQKCQLTEVVIPKHVYSIGGGCFSGNLGLSSVKFEKRSDDRLLSIGDHCFRNNSVLKEITLPNTNISLGTNIFYDCIYNHRTTKTNQKYPSVNL